MARLLAAVAMMALFVANVAADTAATKPEQSVPSYFNNYHMVLALRPSEPGPITSELPVVPLTMGNGLNSTSNVAVNVMSVPGPLVIVDQSNYNLFNDSSRMVYLSCDPNNEQSNISPADILNNLMNREQNKPKAIILYTTNNSRTYCSLDGNNLAYSSVWSMISSEDAWSVRNLTSASAGTVNAMIRGNTSDSGSGPGDNGGGNNSAVAMSILYSITGLITLLFLVIIATGAVRAHRHPERYGPRAGYGGRPRQSRARGLARAVLETLPIVKFGDPHPPKGDPDQELESVSGDHHSETRAPSRTTPLNERDEPSAPAETDISRGMTSAVPSSDLTTATSSTKPTLDENLGCSICTEDFTVGEDVRVLPCDHRFHPACIDPWLVNVSGTCPLCRLDLHPQVSQGDSQPPAERPNTSEGTTGQDTTEPEVGQSRRRSRLLDWNRLRHAPVDERIQALRSIREQGQSSGESQAALEVTSERTTLTNRLRDKFHIRTRTQT